MSMSGSIVLSVLKKAVKYSMSPEDVAELYNHIADNLEWSNDCPCTVNNVIAYVDSEINDKYSSVDKQAYTNWLNKYK